MKHVNFNKITIKNFLSVGSDPITVDFSPGLHIITGVNKDKEDRRNGVGKSTIADAIHFAVFGSPIRELKKENIVNHINGNGCEVTLEFSITKNDVDTRYKVVRMLEPSRCILYIDDVDQTRDSIANTSEYICSILSTSQEIFQNCVIMTVNNTVPFMGKKKIEKRKFIEGVFNLEVFSQMLSMVRHDYNDVKRDFDIEQTRVEEAQKALNVQTDQKTAFIKSQREKLVKYKDRKESNTNELETLKRKVFDTTDTKELDKIAETLTTLEDNVDACDDKISQVNNNIATKTAEIKFKEQTRDKIGTSEDKCPVCLKSISNTDRNHIDLERQNVTDDVEALRVKVDEDNANLTTLKALKVKLKEGIISQNNLFNEHTLKIKDSENNEKRISQLQEWNNQLDQDLEKLKTENTQFDDEIQKCNSRLLELQNKIDNVKHKLTILDAIKFIVSEEGVKSYIVRKILQLFNSKLSYYLQRMDANCCCIFNEYFEEEIVNEKGKMCSYYNFSGAERKNIDLACLFAFMDIRRLQGNVSYNFSCVGVFYL